MANVYEGQPDSRQSADQAMPVSRFRPMYRALSDDEKALHDAINALAMTVYRQARDRGELPRATSKMET